MTLLLLVPAILSFLCLGAHFLREGNYFMTVLSAAMPLLLLVRSPFVLRAMQILLVFMGVFWVLILRDIVNMRIAEHRPFKAAVIILGSVAAFNVLSAAMMFAPRLRTWFSWRANSPAAIEQAKTPASR